MVLLEISSKTMAVGAEIRVTVDPIATKAPGMPLWLTPPT